MNAEIYDLYQIKQSLDDTPFGEKVDIESILLLLPINSAAHLERLYREIIKSGQKNLGFVEEWY